MKLFIIDENRPHQSPLMLALLTIPHTTALLFHLVFTLQIVAESTFAYFFGLVAFIAYAISVVWENRSHD